MKIAVIGSGVAGLGAAWALGRVHDVVIYEAAPKVGGHTNTVVVDAGAGPRAIDTGFIVHNPVNYPHLIQLFQHLGVATQPSAMSFALSALGGRVEYSGGGKLTGLFAQLSLLVSPRHWRMLIDILRFFRHTKRLLAAGALPDVTLGAFLDKHRYSDIFQRRFLCPMAGAIWSTSTREVREFPFPAFARFFESHGLLNLFRRPKWRTVTGGSQRYVDALLANFSGQVRVDAAVTAISRDADGVTVTTADGAETFDAVVCATHGDTAHQLLADADNAEADVLGRVRYATNRAVLHTDRALLPKRRATWSSWNVLRHDDALTDAPVCLSYWMNKLQTIDDATDYIVTLNPIVEPDPATVLYETTYTHPQYTPDMLAAHAGLPAIQGARGVWWCGAWTGYGFHEDGLASGLAVARALGAPAPWDTTDRDGHGSAQTGALRPAA